MITIRHWFSKLQNIVSTIIIIQTYCNSHWVDYHSLNILMLNNEYERLLVFH